LLFCILPGKIKLSFMLKLIQGLKQEKEIC